MRQVTNYSDGRNRSWCVHCGEWLWPENSSKDHVPTRGLLVPSYPENLPVVQVCLECNTDFSRDEEYFIAWIAIMVSGSIEPDPVRFPKAARILDRSPLLRDRITQFKIAKTGFLGRTETKWRTELHRIEQVITKNARGHVLYKINEPAMEPPTLVRFAPLHELPPQERGDFEDVPFEDVTFGSVLPELGSRGMQKAIVIVGERGPVGVFSEVWQEVQEGVYRYAVSPLPEGVLVRSVLYEYLATEVRWRY